MSHLRGGGRVISTIVGDLPYVEGKNPVIAAILGFLFGGLGLGLYFWSWKDFLYPVLVFIVTIIFFGSFVLPIIGVMPGWLVGSLFASGWGVWRANGGGG